jgi:hypothetical protein
MRAFRFLILTAAVVALGGARAAAADPPPIRLSVPACSTAPFSVEAFLGSLEVELAGHLPACCLLDRAPPSPRDAQDDPGSPQLGLRVTLSIDPCDASATAVDVRVRDPARPAGLARRVGLGDIPLDARPRALALAVAELVHSATATPPPAPPVTAPAPPVTAPPPPMTAPAPPMTAPAPPAASSARAGDSGGAPRPRPPSILPWIFVSGILELETHPGNNMTLWGVRPSLAVARGHWQAALDVDLMAGDPSVSLGDVSTRMLAGTLAVGPRLALGHLVLDVAACGRFGWAWMAGNTSDANAVARSGSAPLASAGGRLGIFLPTAARVSHLRALVEAGAMTHGLEATVNGTTATGLTGGYILFGVGFGENR